MGRKSSVKRLYIPFRPYAHTSGRLVRCDPIFEFYQRADITAISRQYTLPACHEHTILPHFTATHSPVRLFSHSTSSLHVSAFNYKALAHMTANLTTINSSVNFRRHEDKAPINLPFPALPQNPTSQLS